MTFYSDNGGRCYRCGGTIYRYEVRTWPVLKIETFCYGCHAAGFFFPNREPSTAADCSHSHRAEVTP